MPLTVPHNKISTPDGEFFLGTTGYPSRAAWVLGIKLKSQGLTEFYILGDVELAALHDLLREQVINLPVPHIK